MESFIILIISMASFLLFFFWRLVISPLLTYHKFRKIGFVGPPPKFPLGNMAHMKMEKRTSSFGPFTSISNDFHSSLFPYFARWQKLYGKVFLYWLGTEPFLYVTDPEFLRLISADVIAKNWGKPDVFKGDRRPMFGIFGLVMTEGDVWVRHRQNITPAFSPPNLKAMTSIMFEAATKMLDHWTTLINNGKQEIDFETEIVRTAGEIIARTSFGISGEEGETVFKKLRELQYLLFKSHRYVGVPFSRFVFLKQNREAKKLGKEIDDLLLSIIVARKISLAMSGGGDPQNDLLGLLITEGYNDSKEALTTAELVDECKTFFFGGHETTALALTWTLMLLAMHPEWQDQLREEIREVVGDRELDVNLLPDLKKVGWVFSETMRLYPSAPNVQRQTRDDIRVKDVVVPKGTNLWFDVIAVHHDPTLWGDDVFEFKPERFKDDLYGGCKHKMGYMPFGYGGRMCIGRNFAAMEYKIVLILILSRFSFSLSPTYCHSPSIVLSFRPAYGLPLIIKPIEVK